MWHLVLTNSSWMSLKCSESFLCPSIPDLNKAFMCSHSYQTTLSDNNPTSIPYFHYQQHLQYTAAMWSGILSPELGLVNQSIETELLFLHKAIGFGMITVCEQYMPPEYCGNFRDVQYAVIFGHCIQVSVKHLLFQTRTLMWQNPHQMRDHTTLLPVEERPVSNTWWTVHCKQLVFVQEFPQHWYKECTTICSGNHLNRHITVIKQSQIRDSTYSNNVHTLEKEWYAAWPLSWHAHGKW